MNAIYEHSVRNNLSDYTQKLVTSSGVVPDPFNLKEG